MATKSYPTSLIPRVRKHWHVTNRDDARFQARRLLDREFDMIEIETSRQLAAVRSLIQDTLDADRRSASVRWRDPS